MPYSPQNWVDGPLGNTPLHDARLNYIEAGLVTYSVAADALATSKENVGVAATQAANAIAGHLAATDPHPQYLNSARHGGAALLNVGVITGTVAAGDDTRITGAAQVTANLADLTSVTTARTNLGLGASATRNVGTLPGTVAAGDDTRIVAGYAKPDLSGVGDTPGNIGPSNVVGTSVKAARADHTHAGVPFANPAFTGSVTLGQDPVNALEAATKQYVDARTLLSVGSVGARPVAPYTGQTIWRSDKNWIEVWDGTAWRVQGVVSCAALADITNPLDGQRAYLAGGTARWRYRVSDAAWYALAPVQLPAPTIATAAVSAGATATLATLSVTDPGWAYTIWCSVALAPTPDALGNLALAVQNGSATWATAVIAGTTGYAQVATNTFGVTLPWSSDGVSRTGARTLYLVGKPTTCNITGWGAAPSLCQIELRPA